MSNERFLVSLNDLASITEPAHMIASSYLRSSKTFVIYERIMETIGFKEKYFGCELGHEPERYSGLYLKRLISEFRRNSALVSLVISDPFKQRVIPLLDELTPRAIEIGAVNLVIRRSSYLIGDNLDGEAFLMSLSRYWNIKADLNRAVFFGCGGVSSAASIALSNRLEEIALIDIEPLKVTRLANKLLEKKSGLRISELRRPGALDLRSFNVFYNGTGLGKHSHDRKATEASPLEAGDSLPTCGLAIDANYTPWQTSFLHDMDRRGFDTVNGFGHMVAFVSLHISAVTPHSLDYDFVMETTHSLFTELRERVNS